MTKKSVVILLLLALFGLNTGALASQARPADRLSLAGAIRNLQGKGIKEVEIGVLVNGQPIKPLGKGESIYTGSQGNFLAEFQLPAGTLPGGRVEVRAHKPCWRESAPTPVKVIDAGIDQAGNRLCQAQQQFTLYRQITPAFWLATLVLLLVYIIIAAELMHRTLAAFLGAALLLFITYTLRNL